MDLEELKSHLEDLEANKKIRDGGLIMAREQEDQPEFNMIELVQEKYDRSDLISNLIKAITLNESDNYMDGSLLPAIREITDNLNDHYKDEIDDRIFDVAGMIEDIDDFGEGVDAEYRRNGFDGEAGFWAYKEG